MFTRSSRAWVRLLSTGSARSAEVQTSVTLGGSGYVDYYGALEVSRDDTVEQFRLQYHKFAKQYHPDKTSEWDELKRQWAESKFKLISTAYNVLSCPQKRQHYDTFMDLYAIGNQSRMMHWMAIHRPPPGINSSNVISS